MFNIGDTVNFYKSGQVVGATILKKKSSFFGNKYFLSFKQELFDGDGRLMMERNMGEWFNESRIINKID